LSDNNSKKYVLNLSQGDSQQLLDALSKADLKIISEAEITEFTDLAYILVDHEASAIELLNKYDTLNKNIDVIVANDVESLREFFLCNGRAAIDPEWLNYDVAKILFSNYINNAGSLHLDEIFTGKLGEFKSNKIINHNRLGYYADEIAVEAFDNNFNVVSIRSYLDHFIYYLTYLKQAGVASVPFEIEYSWDKDFFVLLIHSKMVNFVAEYLIDCFGKENPNDPLSFLLQAASRSCDMFNLNFIDTASKICAIGVWKNYENKDLKDLKHSVLFNNIKTSGQILSLIEEKMRQARKKGPSEKTEDIGFEEKYKKVESKKLPGNIIEMVVSPDEDSTFHSKPKLASQLIAFSIAEFEEMHPDRDLKSMVMDELKNILKSYKDQEVIEDLSEDDLEHLLERIHKHSISSVYEDEVSRVRAQLQDDEDFQAKLTDTTNEDIVEEIARKMNVGMVNSAITRGSWKDDVMVIGGANSFKPEGGQGQSNSTWDSDKVTVKGSANRKKFKPVKISDEIEEQFADKIGKNLKQNAKDGNFFTPDHHRQLDKEIDQFINELPDMEGDAKLFLSQNIPPAITKKVAEHAEKIGKSVDELEEDEVTMFVQSAFRETLREQADKFNTKNGPRKPITLADLTEEQIDSIEIPDDHPTFPPGSENSPPMGVQNLETEEVIALNDLDDLGYIEDDGLIPLGEGERIIPLGNGDFGIMDDQQRIRPVPPGKKVGFKTADGKVEEIDQYYNFVSVGENGEAVAIPKMPKFEMFEKEIQRQRNIELGVDPETPYLTDQDVVIDEGGIDPAAYIPENMEISKNFRGNFQEHLKKNLAEIGKKEDELTPDEFKGEQIQTIIKGSIRQSLDDEFKINSLSKESLKQQKGKIVDVLSPSFELDQNEVESIFDENVNKAILKENQEIVNHLFSRGDEESPEEGLPEGQLVQENDDGTVELVDDPDYVAPAEEPQYQLDENGDPILDEDGNPIPVENAGDNHNASVTNNENSVAQDQTSGGTSFEETALLNKLSEYESENKLLLNQIAVLESEVKAKQDVLDIKEEIDQNAEEYVKNQQIESDYDPPTVAEQVEMNRIKEQLNKGEELKKEQVELINQMLNKEAKMVEFTKEHDRTMKKANIEFGRKEMLFNREIEKARKDARTKEKVLERAKQGLAMLNKSKDKEIQNLRKKLDGLKKQGLATSGAKQDFKIKAMEEERKQMKKTVEMYKTKLNQAMAHATKQLNKAAESHSATELRRLERVKIKLEQSLIEKDKMISQIKQQAEKEIASIKNNALVVSKDEAEAVNKAASATAEMVNAGTSGDASGAEVMALQKKIEELEKSKAEEIRQAVEKTTKDMEAMFEGMGDAPTSAPEQASAADNKPSGSKAGDGKELTKAKEQVADLKKESLQKEQKNKQLETKVKELEKTLSDLDKGSKGQVSPVKFKQMETNYNKMKKDFKKNEEEVKKSRSELTRLKASKATLENKVKDLEKQLAKAKGKKAA
jgi:hypothetical protein